MEYGRGPNDRDNGDFARPQHYPVSRGNGVPPKTLTSTGPTLVVTLALSSVAFHSTRVCEQAALHIMVSMRKMVWT